MLDPKLIKEKPQIIRDMLKEKSIEFDLDEFLNYLVVNVVNVSSASNSQ